MGTFLQDGVLPPTKVDDPEQTARLAALDPKFKASAAEWNQLLGAVGDLHTDARTREFNARHYGAKGDGGDDTAAIQAALNLIGALPQYARPTIRLPAGTYRVGDLNVPARELSIVGEGPESTTLEYTGTTGALFTLGTFQASPPSYYVNTGQRFRLESLRLRHPTFDGYGPGFDGVRTATAIRDNGSGDLLLYDALVQGFRYGLMAAYGSDFNSVINCHFKGNDTAIYLGPKSDQFRCERTQFTAGMEGVVVEGATQGSLVSCYFVDNATTDVAFIANTTTRSGVTAPASGAYELRWSLSDCWHESGAGYGTNRGPTSHILLDGNSSAFNPRHVTIERPYLVSGGTPAPGTYFVNVQSGRQVRLTDLTVYGQRIAAVFNMKAAHFAPVYQENTRIADGFSVPLWANTQVGMRYFDPFTNSHKAYSSQQAWLDLDDATASDKRVRLRNNSDDSFSLLLWDTGTSAYLERVKFHLGAARVELNTRTIDFGTAVPTTGTWVQGSVRHNSAAAVGQPKGWRCTVGGSPGTWVSEGNL